MAIQTINDALPTGDSPRQINQKINENFTNSEHAASRLVGKSNGNLVEMTSDGVAGTGWGTSSPPQVISDQQLHNLANTGLYKVIRADIATTGAPPTANDSMIVLNMSYAGNYNIQMALTRGSSSSKMFFRGNPSGRESTWLEIYSTGNTTIEEGTNYLKVASPILRLQHDAFVKEHEAEKMDIVVDNPSVGVYKITGTTGLRNDGTWYFSPPKDEHNNVLCMVEASEENGVITVNTYKKLFDFEIVSIVPDYEQPTDIPEGAVVMLRFNDSPQEELE